MESIRTALGDLNLSIIRSRTPPVDMLSRPYRRKLPVRAFDDPERLRSMLRKPPLPLVSRGTLVGHCPQHLTENSNTVQ